MAREGTLRVTGYTELMRACQRGEKDSRLFVRHRFAQIGDMVREPATAMFAKYDTRSAAGFKVRVRQRGVGVEQSLRRTTGRHPEFGRLQMVKALLPALADKEGTIEHELQDAINEVADRFAL